MANKQKARSLQTVFKIQIKYRVISCSCAVTFRKYSRCGGGGSSRGKRIRKKFFGVVLREWKCGFLWYLWKVRCLVDMHGMEIFSKGHSWQVYTGTPELGQQAPAVALVLYWQKQGNKGCPFYISYSVAIFKSAVDHASNAAD